MFNSFHDDTKPAIESVAICNATGLDAPSEGLTYTSGSVDDIASLMRSQEAGGVLEAESQVAVKAATEYQRNCFEE